MSACTMILVPSREGSPDVECGNPVSRSWENVPCCEGCYLACAKQEALDNAARLALLTGSGGADHG